MARGRTCRGLGDGRSWWTCGACPPLAAPRSPPPPWLEIWGRRGGKTAMARSATPMLQQNDDGTQAQLKKIGVAQQAHL